MIVWQTLIGLGIIIGFFVVVETVLHTWNWVEDWTKTHKKTWELIGDIWAIIFGTALLLFIGNIVGSIFIY